METITKARKLDSELPEEAKANNTHVKKLKDEEYTGAFFSANNKNTNHNMNELEEEVEHYQEEFKEELNEVTSKLKSLTVNPSESSNNTLKRESDSNIDSESSSKKRKNNVEDDSNSNSLCDSTGPSQVSLPPSLPPVPLFSQ